MQDVDKLRQRVIDRQTIFELAAPPSYKDFFADSYSSACLFYFNLLPVQKGVCLAWKQHVLIVSYGTEFEVLKVLS